MKRGATTLTILALALLSKASGSEARLKRPPLVSKPPLTRPQAELSKASDSHSRLELWQAELEAQAADLEVLQIQQHCQKWQPSGMQTVIGANACREDKTRPIDR